jgi:hypothetical protein
MIGMGWWVRWAGLGLGLGLWEMVLWCEIDEYLWKEKKALHGGDAMAESLAGEK